MRVFIQRIGVPVVTVLAFLALTAGVVAFAQTKDAKKAPPPNPADFAPESATIGGIKKLYGPVEFTHKAHVGYAGDCAACHHHSPAGEYHPCGKCHSASEVKTAQDRLPGLKAAYHRQCMDCHKAAGSGPMGCTDCHEKVKQPAPPKAEEKKAAAPKTNDQPKTREQ
jgi:hypothetical protein